MATLLQAVLSQATAVLEAAEVDFCLVGGLAVGNRAALRFTRDVDLAIATADDRESEAITRVFLSSRYGFLATVKQDDTDRFATLRLRPPAPNGWNDEEEVIPILDILFASSGIERETVAAATPVLVGPDLLVKTAAIPHLIAMKLLSVRDGRPQDRPDLIALIQAATEKDLQEVEKLLELIAERGATRGRDLPKSFEAHRMLASDAAAG